MFGCCVIAAKSDGRAVRRRDPRVAEPRRGTAAVPARPPGRRRRPGHDAPSSTFQRPDAARDAARLPAAPPRHAAPSHAAAHGAAQHGECRFPRACRTFLVTFSDWYFLQSFVRAYLNVSYRKESKNPANRHFTLLAAHSSFGQKEI